MSDGTVTAKTCACGNVADRLCARCGAPVCSECAVYRGEKPAPGRPSTCTDCDYKAYLATHGG